MAHSCGARLLRARHRGLVCRDNQIRNGCLRPNNPSVRSGDPQFSLMGTVTDVNNYAGFVRFRALAAGQGITENEDGTFEEQE